MPICHLHFVLGKNVFSDHLPSFSNFYFLISPKDIFSLLLEREEGRRKGERENFHFPLPEAPVPGGSDGGGLHKGRQGKRRQIGGFYKCITHTSQNGQHNQINKNKC